MKHTPRKRFGQNFLHDPAVIERLIDIIAPLDQQSFVEIGPGKGAMTRPLLERGARVHVVEIDRDLAARWEAEAANNDRLTVICADALSIDADALVPGDEPVRLVGNLPYNISTPLLFRFAALAHRFVDLHLMLQKEVVARMCAEPGNKTYGRLTVMLAPHFRCQRMLRVAAGAFSPAPKVESAFVRLEPHATPPFELTSHDSFDRLVRAAFSMRRKTLRNSLRGLLDGDDFEAAQIDPGARPESLTPNDFARLADRAAERGDLR